MGGIQHHRRRGPAGLGQPREYPVPNTFARPPDEPVVQRLVRPVMGRGILPSAAQLKNVDDPRYHTTVIDPRNATGIRRQQRRQPPELLIT